MTSDRSYRRALPHEVAVAEIERCSATQFDPELASTFTEGIDGYREEQRARGAKIPE
jgi:HD-GYP domain-containing protein (c-di-GMP phosphodiesterase class II)